MCKSTLKSEGLKEEPMSPADGYPGSGFEIIGN
jgi:hypothetical protein